MENIKKAFKKDTILLIYRCGSFAFGTSTENSEEDYIVVLKNFNGLGHYEVGRKEYFIFGINEWIEKQEFSDDYDDYYEIFNDEVLSFPNNIIYQDDSIKDLVEKFKNEFKDKYKIWIKKVVRHFDSILRLTTINKSMYHLIRIKHIIENYKKFGSFSLELSKEVSDLIYQFKIVEDKYQYKDIIIDAITYLKHEGGD